MQRESGGREGRNKRIITMKLCGGRRGGSVARPGERHQINKVTTCLRDGQEGIIG